MRAANSCSNAPTWGPRGAIQLRRSCGDERLLQPAHRAGRGRRSGGMSACCKGRAGTPTTVTPAGTDFVTTAPLPTASSRRSSGASAVPLIITIRTHIDAVEVHPARDMSARGEGDIVAHHHIMPDRAVGLICTWRPVMFTVRMLPAQIHISDLDPASVPRGGWRGELMPAAAQRSRPAGPAATHPPATGVGRPRERRGSRRECR